jgi:hypothetical protein
VPKVPKTLRLPFWHFWHLVILGVFRNTIFTVKIGGMILEERTTQKGILVRCPEKAGH